MCNTDISQVSGENISFARVYWDCAQHLWSENVQLGFTKALSEGVCNVQVCAKVMKLETFASKPISKEMYPRVAIHHQSTTGHREYVKANKVLAYKIYGVISANNW